MKDQIIKLAHELCSIPSISGSEVDVLEAAILWLKQSGLTIEKIPVDEKRYNIFAYFSKRKKYNAIFSTHLDTVAPFIAPSLSNDKKILHGRGACDAKGIASAMIFSVLEQKAQGFVDLALLLTVGEEEDSDGAKACNEILKDRARFLVIGEPTDLKAAQGQKGTLVFDLVASGVEAHSSLPHLGESAIHKLVNDINKLINYPWPNDVCFENTTINFGKISGGHARNILANFAQTEAIMRTTKPTNDLIELVKSQLSEGVLLKIKSCSDPCEFFVPNGFQKFLASFGTDAPYLRKVGQPILLGPGSLALAHKENEHIGCDELYAGFLAYQKIAFELRKHKT